MLERGRTFEKGLPEQRRERIMRSAPIAMLAVLLATAAEYAGQIGDYVGKGRRQEMKRALLVIDVQNEYFTGKLPIAYPPGSLDNIVKAMEKARKGGIPVVVIQHTSPQKDAPVFGKGTEGWKLHPRIAEQAYDHMLEKNLPGSFTGTDLESWLRERKIDTVVITGYMTQMCCDTTARQAVHMGLAVEFLSDATGTLPVSNKAGSVTAEELHRAILVTQAMRFSRVMTTDQWIESLR
jgi:nicotinamidase-related amidase